MNGVQADWVTLRLFLTAVELGSITRAALRCGIAPSAAAKRLRVLEEECGLPLLDRGSRGVRPTVAGEAATQHARALFDLSARFADDLRAFAAGGQGHVRLHATASVIAGHDLGPSLAAFLEERPGIRVELREDASAVILHDLVEGRADLGLVTGTGEMPPTLQAGPWRKDHLVVLVPPGHPLATRPGIRFAEVLDHPVIGVQESGALSLLLAEQARQLGRGLAFRFQVAGTDAARSLVAAGLGITIMPDGLVHPAGSRPGLVTLPLRETWARRQLWLVARPQETLPPPARLLRDHLLSSVRNLRTRTPRNGASPP
jgi:DNA-binding transcriptional LysR family regulator